MVRKNTKKTVKHAKHAIDDEKPESFKEQLLEVDKQENEYDELFDKKLAEQYREFRKFKEHGLQIKKFIRILGILIILILLALWLLTFG